MAKEMFKQVQTRKDMGSFSCLTKDKVMSVWIFSQPPGESGLTGGNWGNWGSISAFLSLIFWTTALHEIAEYKKRI